MSGQVGTVTAVQSERRGAIATSWVGTVMSVVNAADLDREGGLLSPDDGQTTYAYTGVTDGATELDPDTVTMADSAPAEWPTDTTDPETGDVIPAEVRLDVWPERLDVTAMVDLGDGETIPAVVPHALRPLLVDGVRSEDAESVRIDNADGTWTVSDVLGRRAEVPMSGLAPDVVQAIESASAAGMTRWDAVTDPTQDGHQAGDMWWRHDGSVTGHVIGQWHWDGSAWIADTLDGAVIANLDAGSITSGSLSGIGIYSPSKTSAPRLEIDGSTLSIIRPMKDADGTVTGEQTTTVFGGETADQLQFYDADNQVKGGFDPDGVMTSQSVLTNSISIAGTDILDITQQAPQGIVSGHNFTSPINNLGQTELAIVDLQFTAVPGRTYQFQVNNSFYIPKTGRLILYFRPLLGTDGSDTVGKPTPTTPMAGYGIFSPAAYYSANSAQQVAFTYLWQPTGITQPTACRVLLSALFQGSGSASLIDPTGGFFVNDMGSTYTGIFADGNFDAPPVVTKEETFTAASWQQYYGGGMLYFLNDPIFKQGYVAGNGYEGKSNQYTMVWFSDAMRNAISGAQSIAYIDVLLNCQYYGVSSGTIPRLTPHNNSSAPSTASSVGAAYDFTPERISVGGSVWVRLPSSWYANIANGTWKGLTSGLRVGQDQNYRGWFFNGSSWWTPDPIQFRARYTK